MSEKRAEAKARRVRRRGDKQSAMNSSREIKESRAEWIHRSTGVEAAAGTSALESDPPAFAVDGADEYEMLHRGGALSREEVLRRRSRRLKQLARCYSQQYWALMEEIRVKHRDYYWEHGVSPFEEDEEDGSGAGANGSGGRGRGPAAEVVSGLVVGAVARSEEIGKGARGFVEGERSSGRREERKRCAFSGCKSKAMPLTRFCHPHILADKKQTLYKPCNFVTKSCGQSGPITCGRPVLRAAIPSLCHVHLQKSQRSMSQALRRAGLSIFSSSRPAPKFNVLISDFILQVQGNRKEQFDSCADALNC